MASGANPILFERICVPCAKNPDWIGVTLVDKDKLSDCCLTKEDVKDYVCAKAMAKGLPAEPEPTCASCHTSNSGANLKLCTACKSVSYCNVDCQKAHRKDHKKECKRIEKERKLSKALGGDLKAPSAKTSPRIEDLVDVEIEFILFDQALAAADKKYGSREKATEALAAAGKEERLMAGLMASLPIGTVYEEISSKQQLFFGPRTLEMKMNHSVTCRDCELRGALMDIMMHERLEHGKDLASSYSSEPSLSPYYGPENLGIREDIPGMNDELLALLSAATFKYEKGETGSDEETYTYKKRNCLILFDIIKKEVSDKVAVSIDFSQTWAPGCNWGSLDFCSQLGSGKVPIKLLQIGFGEESGREVEASTHHFDELLDKLGLVDSTRGELVTALLASALPLDELERIGMDMVKRFACKYDNVAKEEMPVLSKAIDLLGVDKANPPSMFFSAF